MQIIKTAETLLLASAKSTPLGVFVVIGSLLEEIIAPIPSPLVGATAGSIAFTQQKGVPYLFLIGLLAALAKTFGCWIFYFVGDKAEDILTSKFGKFFGISHKEIEKIGAMFNGTSKDEIILAFVRSIPIMPTTPVSVACGFIKMNLKSYLGATFVGNYIRGMIFIFMGYAGLSTFTSMLNGMSSVESLINILIVVALAGVLGYVYYNRQKGKLPKFLNQNSKKKK